MLARKFKQFTLYICLIFYCLIGLGNSADAVICFEANGHISIEASCSGFCNPTQEGLTHSKQDAYNAPKGIKIRSPIAPCHDIQLFSNAVSTVSSHDFFILHTVIALLPDIKFSNGFLSFATPSLLSQPPPKLWQSLGFLKTIIILS